MYVSLNIELELTEGQKEEIKKQVEEQIKTLVTENQLKDAVKEVCKGMIKSMVNESIQTKEYRAFIGQKVLKRRNNAIRCNSYKKNLF